jgi:hypothetical protein
MNPRKDVEQTTPTPPSFSEPRCWHVLLSGVRERLRRLVDHGEPALWARRAAGAILVAFGLAVLVRDLVGGR